MSHDGVIWNGAAKVVLAAGVACLVGCASPSPDAADTLPPPPANATASCVYQLVDTGPFFADRDLPTSTLWLDRSGLVIRVDGWGDADSGPYLELPAAYDLTWDAEGRLVTRHGRDYDIQFVYSAEQVLEMYSSRTVTRHLVDGRDVRDEASPDPGTSRSWFAQQTYDAAGRLASHTDGFTDLRSMIDSATYASVFTYDEKGRIASFQSRHTPDDGNSTNYSFSYTETADRLVVDVIDLRDPRSPMIAQTWTFEFDASHRLVRDTVDSDGDGYDDAWDDFRYLDGEIDDIAHTAGFDSTTRASGACAPPSVVLAPTAPLPIQFQLTIQYRSLPNEAARALSNLGAAGSLVPFPYY